MSTNPSAILLQNPNPLPVMRLELGNSLLKDNRMVVIDHFQVMGINNLKDQITQDTVAFSLLCLGPSFLEKAADRVTGH